MWGSLSLKRSRLKGKGCRHCWHIWSRQRCSEFIMLTFNILSTRKHSRVQHNIRLSPLPSPRPHEVPTEVSFFVHLQQTIISISPAPCSHLHNKSLNCTLSSFLTYSYFIELFSPKTFLTKNHHVFLKHFNILLFYLICVVQYITLMTFL